MGDTSGAKLAKEDVAHFKEQFLSPRGGSKENHIIYSLSLLLFSIVDRFATVLMNY
jgi:hypothetical protein